MKINVWLLQGVCFASKEKGFQKKVYEKERFMTAFSSEIEETNSPRKKAQHVNGGTFCCSIVFINRIDDTCPLNSEPCLVLYIFEGL